MYDHLTLISGRAHPQLAADIAEYLGVPLADVDLSDFPDGETSVRLNQNVRGRDVFLIQSTGPPVNQNLMELLILIDTCMRASAARITVVLPYFGYARQDRKDEGRVPITAKLVANLITAAGADRVLCMDLHAAQIQGFFDIPVDHLPAAPVILEYVEKHRAELGNLVVVSPDIGNVKVANWFADHLGCEWAIIDKRRTSGFEVSTRNVIGDVADRTVLMIDDMISTGGTICEAASIVTEHGASDVLAAATHGVFVGGALGRIAAAPISRIIVTDTIPDGERARAIKNKLVYLTVGRLLGEAVYRIHHNLSVSAMFQQAAGTKR
jgi:ribose-phosphate pyrophosphokinase